MATLPEHSEMIANILATYARATVEDRRTGRKWYRVARTFALGLATRHYWSHEQAAGVVAALSPRTSWELNQRNAVIFGDTGNAPTLSRNVETARKIRDGATLDDALKGPKTRAFAANILGDLDRVTVDRHALRIAGIDDLSVTRKQYDQVAAAYQAAAALTSESPSSLQAITWIVQRGRPS